MAKSIRKADLRFFPGTGGVLSGMGMTSFGLFFSWLNYTMEKIPVAGDMLVM
jgi:hypothetical protein